MYRVPDDNSYRDHPHITNGSYPRAPPSASTYSYSYDRRSPNSSDLPTTTSHTYHYSEPVTGNPLILDRPRGNPIPRSLNSFSGSPQSHAYAPEPRSAMTGPSSEYSVDSDSWQDRVLDMSRQEAPKPKKARREKPHIELAPDQPPTTQGKPRARVYVACQQCRTRKIRCDGAKPICHNCSRRACGSECNYDPVPKRRGPDKTPGARQRMARDLRNAIEDGPRRRRRTCDTFEVHQTNHQQVEQAEVIQNARYSTHSLLDSSPLDFPPLVAAMPLSDGRPLNPSYSRSSYSQDGNDRDNLHRPNILDHDTLPDPRKPISTINNYHADYYIDNLISSFSGNQCSYIAELDENGDEKQNDTAEISSGPSLNFSRKIWWDSLLCLYLSPNSNRLQRLSASQRESASQSITADLRFIFRSSNYWFSFFHIPTFFSNYFDPPRREKIQPSLVLALLAMSTFWQSSEIGYGEEGRERALRFRDEAQAAMDASFNAGWIDETLAQAAWLLALFEVCAHPYHSSERSTSSMVMLDSIIRSLSLTLVDAGDPDTTKFSPGTVPAVSNPKPQAIWLPSSPIPPPLAEEAMYKTSHSQPEAETGCSCRKFTLEGSWPSSSDHAPLWSSTPAWDESWTEAEIRKESCRRLCWSSMILAAGHISYTTAQRSQGLDLFISDPSNYALLFSGESVARSPILSRHSSKDTIWALHDRSFLLWHGCIRMRNHSTATDTDKSQFAIRAWLEADSLEQALNKHTCSLERAFIFQAREYIFNTRMCISYEFQRFIPLVTANVNGLFHRNKAEEWLTHQSIVAERFMYGLHTITGNASNLLARRPFFVFWFMGQIHRALALYECDSTLLVALDVCKALIPAIDYLTVLWPCAEQRRRYESLRGKVVSACYIAGIEPPAAFNHSLSVPGSPQGLI